MIMYEDIITKSKITTTKLTVKNTNHLQAASLHRLLTGNTP